MDVWVLDSGAGNVLSLHNALLSLGAVIHPVTSPADIAAAKRLIFPGVGAFGTVVEAVRRAGLEEALVAYVRAGRPFLGICVGLQALFEASEESPGVRGLGVVPGTVRRLRARRLSVPHMGWNTAHPARASALLPAPAAFYFVHSYAAPADEVPADWLAARTFYGPGDAGFACALERGAVCATQFHPEKSGRAGLALLRRFLAAAPPPAAPPAPLPLPPLLDGERSGLARRLIACMDVRSDEEGRLVVTKGEGYNVKEGGVVRNLGQPDAMAAAYYAQGADEVVFLAITAYKQEPLRDEALHSLLRATAARCFVPLTIGGGIRAYTDSAGRAVSAVDVAASYFRSGADKVSLGTDAVLAAMRWHDAAAAADGSSSIEAIARVYGRQAVVVSIDPRRVYVADGAAPPVAKWGHAHALVELPEGDAGPHGERRCWWEATMRGGKERSGLDVAALVRAVDALGAGELLVNSLDRDGARSGYDLPLLRLVRAHTRLPVVASSGAGRAEHFVAAFEEAGADAALAAGVLHRGELALADVRDALAQRGLSVRRETHDNS